MKAKLTQYGRTINVNVHATQYHDGSLAVLITDIDAGVPYATLSCNIEDAALLPADCFHAKTWSENEGIVEQLVAQNVIRRRSDLPSVHSGFVVAHAYEFLYDHDTN